jgi:hypothetical protein
MQIRSNFKLAHSNLFLTYNLSSSLCAVAYLHKSYNKNVTCTNAVQVAYSDDAQALVQQQMLLHAEAVAEKKQ